MWKYITKRLAMVSFVIAGVTLVSFSAMYLAPGDPAELIALARYGQDLSVDQIQSVREMEGLDAPVHIQYFIWLDHLMHLDLGRSIVTSDNVLDEILLKLPATVKAPIVSPLTVNGDIMILASLLSGINNPACSGICLFIISSAVDNNVIPFSII